MAIISIRQIRRRVLKDQERVDVAGAMNVVNRQGSVRAGSFQLKHIDGIIFGPADMTGKRMLTGSVRNPTGTNPNPGAYFVNTVLVRPIFIGGTGTRIGPTVPALGSTASFGTTPGYFHCWGY